MSEYTSSTAIMTGQVPGGSGGSGGSGGTPLGTVLDDVYTWLGRFIATIDEADRSLRLSPWPPPPAPSPKLSRRSGGEGGGTVAEL